MRHHQRHIFMGIPIAFEKSTRDFGHSTYCVFKNLLSVLMDVMHLLIQCHGRCWMSRTASGHAKKFTARTINVVDKIENALGIGL